MRSFFKILLFIVIVIFIFHTLLRVKITNIDISGNKNVSDAEIVANLFKNDLDRSSIVFFIKSKFNKKKDIPLVSSYDIEWITPFSITVKVHENKPVAFMKRDLKNIYFDKNGVITEATSERKPGIIEVLGVSFKNYEKGSVIDTSNEKVLKAILNITNYLSEQGFNASLLEIIKEENFFVYIDNIVVNLGNTDNMEIKLSRLSDIYPEISHLNGTLDLSNARENMLDEQYIFKKAN